MIVYERNDVTNALLRKNNIDAIEIPSAELSVVVAAPAA